ncbi:MAG: hypothetical protein HON90_06810 [Halobacteriovoraceae bacterium]|jgi:hypothetical protein|nr:hypothetical protein [Halobacteriovoraceae bacterium]
MKKPFITIFLLLSISMLFTSCAKEEESDVATGGGAASFSYMPEPSMDCDGESCL